MSHCLDFLSIQRPLKICTHGISESLLWIYNSSQSLALIVFFSKGHSAIRRHFSFNDTIIHIYLFIFESAWVCGGGGARGEGEVGG